MRRHRWKCHPVYPRHRICPSPEADGNEVDDREPPVDLDDLGRQERDPGHQTSNEEPGSIALESGRSSCTRWRYAATVCRPATDGVLRESKMHMAHRVAVGFTLVLNHVDHQNRAAGADNLCLTFTCARFIDMMQDEWINAASTASSSRGNRQQLGTPWNTDMVVRTQSLLRGIEHRFLAIDGIRCLRPTGPARRPSAGAAPEIGNDPGGIQHICAATAPARAPSRTSRSDDPAAVCIRHRTKILGRAVASIDDWRSSPTHDEHPRHTPDPVQKHSASASVHS